MLVMANLSQIMQTPVYTKAPMTTQQTKLSTPSAFSMQKDVLSRQIYSQTTRTHDKDNVCSISTPASALNLHPRVHCPKLHRSGRSGTILHVLCYIQQGKTAETRTMRKQGAPSFLTSFLFLLSFFRSSTLMASTPSSLASSQCL